MQRCGSAPDVPGEVIPRRLATPEQLKALGMALANWSERNLGADGLLRQVDVLALLELVGAGDPRPVVGALLGWSPSPTVAPGLSLEDPETRSVFIALRGAGLLSAAGDRQPPRHRPRRPGRGHPH